MKGAIIAVIGMGVLLEVIFKTISGIVPSADTMGIIGALVLLGNGICYLLLLRHRSDDLNMRSTWLCLRNDIIANLSVLVAAIGVKAFNASWPDILVGAAIAALFLSSAFTVLRESLFRTAAIKIATYNRRIITPIPMILQSMIGQPSTPTSVHPFTSPDWRFGTLAEKLTGGIHRKRGVYDQN